MATQPGPVNVAYGWPANADLHTYQFHFVKLSSGKATVCTAAGEFSVGVLNNKPTFDGEMADIVIWGPTKVMAGGAITAGDLITTDANGHAVTVAPSGATDYDKAILGRAMADVAKSGDICGVWINCINPPVAKEAHHA